MRTFTELIARAANNNIDSKGFCHKAAAELIE